MMKVELMSINERYCGHRLTGGSGAYRERGS